MVADLSTTMDALLSCMVEALETAGRPVARSGHTIGPAVLGPTACCAECKDCDGSGQLTVALQRMYPVDSQTFSQQVRLEDCKPGAVAVDLAFTLARCHPTLNNKGAPPPLDTLAPFADGFEDDAQTLWNTFVCPCDDSYKVAIRELLVDPEPFGGCSGVGLIVTVLVKPLTPAGDQS